MDVEDALPWACAGHTCRLVIKTKLADQAQPVESEVIFLAPLDLIDESDNEKEVFASTIHPKEQTAEQPVMPSGRFIGEDRADSPISDIDYLSDSEIKDMLEDHIPRENLTIDQEEAYRNFQIRQQRFRKRYTADAGSCVKDGTPNFASPEGAIPSLREFEDYRSVQPDNTQNITSRNRRNGPIECVGDMARQIFLNDLFSVNAFRSSQAASNESTVKAEDQPLPHPLNLPLTQIQVNETTNTAEGRSSLHLPFSSPDAHHRVSSPTQVQVNETTNNVENQSSQPLASSKFQDNDVGNYHKKDGLDDTSAL